MKNNNYIHRTCVLTNQLKKLSTNPDDRVMNSQLSGNRFVK